MAHKLLAQLSELARDDQNAQRGVALLAEAIEATSLAGGGEKLHGQVIDLEQVVQKIVDRTGELEEAVSRRIPDPSIVPEDDEHFQEQLLDLQRKRELQNAYHANCKRDERARQLKMARISVDKQMGQARAVIPHTPTHTKITN